MMGKIYHQAINDIIKQYNKVRKVSTGQGDDYTTGCLLDFAYFLKNYKLIAADLSKQKALNADSRAIQQIIFTGKAIAAVIIYYILEQSKETILEFSKGTTTYKWLNTVIRYATEKNKNCCQKQNKNNSENKFKNVSWK